MPPRSATVHSIDSVRRLKVALDEFVDEVADTLTLLELESRRPLEWIEQDRSKYWPREFRKASDRVAEARIALERCELTSSDDERRSCYDERKMLEKAKRRLRLCEEKIPIVQRWRLKLRKEIEEFKVQLARMANYLEADAPRAIAALERMAAALDQYVQTSGAPAPIEWHAGGSASGGVTREGATSELGGLGLDVSSQPAETSPPVGEGSGASGEVSPDGSMRDAAPGADSSPDQESAS